MFLFRNCFFNTFYFFTEYNNNIIVQFFLSFIHTHKLTCIIFVLSLLVVVVVFLGL
eukprot:m.77663 g.77663  ORF g.77663 m.77663 type:complete len:56 (-) comp11926_c1_seq1:1091-1258(-)